MSDLMTGRIAEVSTGYTCLSCRVRFTTGEMQRDHYRTEWHRYNLKRKVVGYEPVTEEVFKDRVEAQNAADTGAPTSAYCQACSKSFASKQALESHQRSRRHRVRGDSLSEKTGKSPDAVITGGHVLGTGKEAKREEQADSDSDVEEVSDEEWLEEGDAVAPQDCLFCAQPAKDLTLNLEHMAKEHSFFLPEPEYISDLDGFVEYLGKKVGCGLMCLWCDTKGKQFRSLLAVQRHMRDKGHCKIESQSAEGLLEYGSFYDFSATYPEGEAEEKDEEQDDGTFIGPSELALEEGGAGGFLKLPSGDSIGHRSLARYFRQNMNGRLSEKGRPDLPRRKRTVEVALLNQLRSLGCAHTGLPVAIARQRARDFKFMHKTLKKSYLKVGVNANRLQHHFRIQNPI